MSTLELMTPELVADSEETLRVCSLHAYGYCPRLFYLEEVEELYTQDAAVFAGRRLHEELEPEAEGDWLDLYLEDEILGLRGRVDALKTQQGQLIPYEHKRGRCFRDENKRPQAWESDRLQILAYCCLLEATQKVAVAEGRIRYHADNALVHIPFDEASRLWVKETVETKM